MTRLDLAVVERTLQQAKTLKLSELLRMKIGV